MKELKIEQYLKLKEETQQDLIMRKGVFLFKRTSPEYRIYLYQLYGFYVELVFPKRGGDLEWLRAFVDTDNLEPYLDNIDLSNLVNQQ